MSALTTNSFEKLLIRLDADPNQAAEKYLLLQQKLVKCLTWKGCSETDADSLADTALDRVALKLEKGEEILNLKAYACEVLRFVWLEYNRKHKEEAVGDDNMPEGFTSPEIEQFEDPDDRMRCLRKCLAEVVPNENDRSLIIGYYDLDVGDKIKDIRKSLAEKLGLTKINLKVKASRLRDRLEKCINECVARLSVTKTPNSDTNKQGGDVQ